MQIDEWAIGQRIASHRMRRGLTQQELAGLVGISLSLMKKIESGDRPVTRFSQLVLFAQALRVRDLRELTGVPLPLMPDGNRRHPAVDAVRAALVERQLPRATSPLAELADDIERAWAAWQTASAFRYASVGQRLPDLIRKAQAAVLLYRDEQRRRALREASKLYQLVRTWTKRIGEHELSLLAADRAVSCALEVDDPDLAGAAAWNLAMILSTQGHIDDARRVVYRAIEDLRPSMDDATQARLAVWGGLHLLGATTAARDDQDHEASHLIDLAGKAAATTGETNHFRMVFGPTNVAVHRVSPTRRGLKRLWTPITSPREARRVLLVMSHAASAPPSLHSMDGLAAVAAGRGNPVSPRGPGRTRDRGSVRSGAGATGLPADEEAPVTCCSATQTTSCTAGSTHRPLPYPDQDRCSTSPGGTSAGARRRH